MRPTRLSFRPLAEIQIVEGFNYYRLSSSQRAQAWMDAVDDAFTAIEHFPLGAPVIFDDVRRLKVKNFPYLLLYFVEEHDGERAATVVACIHERSDPQTWRKLN